MSTPSSGNPNTGNAFNVINQMSAVADPTTASGRAAQKHRADMKAQKQNRRERKKYARYIFWMVANWLIAILIVVLLNGFKTFNFKATIASLPWIISTDFGLNFNLTDAVLIALITTTTINVAAFFLAVTQYLFPKQEA
jgi:predicted anti-sigma-YlaC factor YlaD